MTDAIKLISIKLLHTAIWIFFNVVIFYLLIAVITDRIDRWFWIGLGLVGLEVIALLLFSWSCPLRLSRAATPCPPRPTSTSTFLSGWRSTTRGSAVVMHVMISAGVEVGGITEWNAHNAERPTPRNPSPTTRTMVRRRVTTG